MVYSDEDVACQKLSLTKKSLPNQVPDRLRLYSKGVHPTTLARAEQSQHALVDAKHDEPVEARNNEAEAITLSLWKIRIHHFLPPKFFAPQSWLPRNQFVKQ